MNLNPKAIGAFIIVAGLVALYFGAKSASQYHREWSLRRSHAVATAVAVDVSSRQVRGGCLTNVRFEFKPVESPIVYETTNGFLATDDPDCVNVSWSVGDTMEVAYVPANPKIHRPYWGTLERGIESSEWMISGIGATFAALAVVFFTWLRRKMPNETKKLVE